MHHVARAMNSPAHLRITLRSRRVARRLAALAAVLGALLPTGVAAHPYLVSAEPAAGSTLPATPEQITIFYTESLDAPYCSAVLVAPDGTERSAPVGASGTRLTVSPPALRPGTWVLRWTVVGEDGHRVVGDFSFNVQRATDNPAAPAAAAAAAGYASTSDVSPPELVGRALLAVLTVLLCGLLVLGFAVLPADPDARSVAGRRLALLRTGVWALQVAVAARFWGRPSVIAVSPGTAVQAGVLEYVLNLVGVYALALAIDVIGGSIGAQRNRVQALKVAAYGSTPYWLVSAFALFPRIEPLAMLVGLYSIWLFVMGLPAVTKAPRDKNAAYTLLTSIAAVLLVLVITAIITRLVVS